MNFKNIFFMLTIMLMNVDSYTSSDYQCHNRYKDIKSLQKWDTIRAILKHHTDDVVAAPKEEVKSTRKPKKIPSHQRSTISSQNHQSRTPKAEPSRKFSKETHHNNVENSSTRTDITNRALADSKQTKRSHIPSCSCSQISDLTDNNEYNVSTQIAIQRTDSPQTIFTTIDAYCQNNNNINNGSTRTDIGADSKQTKISHISSCNYSQISALTDNNEYTNSPQTICTDIDAYYTERLNKDLQALRIPL